MEITIQKGSPIDLKKKVLDILDQIDFEIDNEADLFLSIISEMVENKIIVQNVINPEQQAEDAIKKLQFQYSRALSRRLEELRRLKDSQSIKEYKSIQKQLRSLPKSEYVPNDLNTAFELFITKLIENSPNKVVTATSIYLTMKGICPLWPFCK